MIVNIIFPHQLFKNNPLFKFNDNIYLIEYFDESCRVKLRLHKASLLYYKDYITHMGKRVQIISAKSRDKFIKDLKQKQTDIRMIDPIENDIYKLFDKSKLTILETPCFLTPMSELKKYNLEHPRAKQETFYRWQRKRLNILMKKDSPIGDQYNFDKLNRSKYPNDFDITKIPKLPGISGKSKKYYKLADKSIVYTNKNHGEIGAEYPCTHEDSEKWFRIFLRNKLALFGKYQDAHHTDTQTGYHSVITPMLNVGLLTPLWIINTLTKYTKKHKVPLESLEAFIRQVIGWREFVRYLYKFSEININMNFFNNKRHIDKSLYYGTTKFEFINEIIHNVSKTGYAHHIIRLMWLGNYFLISGINPKDVYNWFMEFFVDSYNWVMLPNVIGMSQYADGGIMATRPYFSSAAYLLRMSNIKRGPWVEEWNKLFNNFVRKNKNKLKKLYLVSSWVKD